MIHFGKVATVLILAAFVGLLWPGSVARAEDPTSTLQGDKNNWDDYRSHPGRYWAQIDHTDPPPPNDEKPRQRRKHLEQLRLLKLLELLDLTEKQETRFIVDFRKYRKGLQWIHQSRMEAIDRLTTGLKTDSLESAEVYELTCKLDSLGSELQAMRRTFHEEARVMLDSKQFGRLIVFEERFEQALLEQVKAFHERPSRGRGGRGGW